MSPRQEDSFVHRANRDGTTDSICKDCFATVCTSIWETDLARAEHDHVCDPGAIARWQQMQHRNKPEPR